MPVAVYSGTIGISPASFVSPQASIEVEYVISLTSPTSPTPQPNTKALSQNYPNPVSHGQAAMIRFSLEKAGYASIKLYDLFYRQVAKVFDGCVTDGMQQVSFLPSSLPPGVYTYVLTTAARVYSRVMVVVK
jgi:hypothetical protein